MMLPAPRRPGPPYRVALVCLGNICRSPMADVVLTDAVHRAGLVGRVEVVSSGTGDWHLGKPMDRRAAALLTTHGYDASLHRARRFEADWLEDCDLILAMDAANYADITALAGPGADLDRVRMFRDFDPLVAGGDRDVPDPYYGGDDGFATVLTMVQRTCASLVAALAEMLADDGAGDGADDGADDGAGTSGSAVSG
jgi:protein-tyrosine phosphatase